MWVFNAAGLIVLVMLNVWAFKTKQARGFALFVAGLFIYLQFKPELIGPMDMADWLTWIALGYVAGFLDCRAVASQNNDPQDADGNRLSNDQIYPPDMRGDHRPDGWIEAESR